jgi:hypothetical protein
LNDSINTTEFLEENWNAELAVAAFNYTTREYDELPIDTPVQNRGLYRSYSRNGRHMYDKSDGVYCGMLGPQHVSPDGGIRLRLVAHNLDNYQCSGFAWFDYACLTPAGAAGKININTASERVLTSLKDITPGHAANIYRGISRRGRAGVKPYRSISDILDVAGITPEIYGSLCNLITARSDQFRVVVLAQALNDKNNDGVFNEQDGDTISAATRQDAIVDRSGLTDNNPETSRLHVRYSH